MNEHNDNSRDIIAIYARIYLFIKRYFIILIIFLILGIAFGIYTKYTASYFYRKHLVINSVVVHKNISLDMIKSIQLLISEGNHSEIAQKFNIPVEAASSFMSVDTGSFRSKENLGFLVDMQIRDSIYTDTIASGLMFYLNNNKYFRERVKIYLDEKQKILGSLDSKIKQIDSNYQKTNYPFTAAGGENAIIVRSFSTEYVNLLEKKYQTERDIEFGSKVSVVEDTMSKVSTGTSLVKSIIIYGLLVEILGICLALILEAIRLARNYIKLQKK